MKVLVIPADESQSIRREEIPDEGRAQMMALQKLVQGHFEPLRSSRLSMRGNQMLVDEDARLKGTPINLRATRLAAYPIPLLGDIVIIGSGKGAQWTDFTEMH